MKLEAYDIIYLLSSVYGTYIIYKFLGIFFDRKEANRVHEWLFYSAYFCIISILYLTLSIPIVMMVSNLILFFILGLLYSKSIKKCILAAFSIYFILMGVEMAVVLLTGYIYIPVFSVNYYSSIFGILAIRFMSYTVYLIINNYKNIKKGTIIPTSYWVCIIVMPLASLYLMILIFMANGISTISVFLSIILLLLANFSTFYLYDNIILMYEEKIEKAHLSSQNRYYNMQLELMQTSMRAIRAVKHDLVNHLSAINILIKEGDTEQLSEHIVKLTDSCGDKREYAKSGNVVIDSIINFKLHEIEPDNIKVNIKLDIPEKLPITSFDVAVILGNILDNAISATKKIDDNRFIDFQMYLSKGRVIIKSINTFGGQLKYENNEIITTKADKLNHGMGLKNIKQSIKNYNGSFDIRVNDNLFIITILLYI